MSSPDAATPETAALPEDWQALPPRGAALAALGGAIAGAIPLTVLGFVFSNASHLLSPWLATPLMFVLGAAFGAWMGWRRHRRLRWRLDATAFAVRRGNWWQSETHVPISRVQHLDVKRGPLERSLGLCTLIVHTAGTRAATVSVAGLDGGDGERLRDRLARQLDLDDAL